MDAARSYPDGTEQRAAFECRASGRQLVGYAAKFGVSADIGGFTETIKPGAFRVSLATPGADVLALVDHDPARLLARTKSGTLRLVEDGVGLSFSIDLPDTQLGRDTLSLAQRGDLGGCSFGFRVVQEAWGMGNTRTLIEVSLVEISIVQAWPAYDQTTVSARARAMGNAEAAQRVRRMAILGIM